MPTQCGRDRCGYEVVEGREAAAAFDGGDGTTDTGGLLAGETTPPALRAGSGNQFRGCLRRRVTARRLHGGGAPLMLPLKDGSCRKDHSAHASRLQNRAASSRKWRNG